MIFLGFGLFICYGIHQTISNYKIQQETNMNKTLRQIIAIFRKNLLRNMSNPKKHISHFIFPMVISLIYYFYKSQQQSLNPLSIILKFLLTIYLGLIASSTTREIITLFINERQEGARQYQYVMGFCKRLHTLSNLLYMMVYTSIFLLPFYIVLNYLDGIQIGLIFTFAAFVVSSSFLTIALTSFFTQHKVATEIIGIIFSLGSFLPFVYDPNSSNFKHYLAIFMPNSAFSLAILSNDPSQRFKISLSSLVLWKVYLLIFYLVQFRHDFLQSLKKLTSKCRKCINKNKPQNRSQILMNEQIQASSVLNKSQPQNDNMDGTGPTIELVNVQKKFGKFVAVKNVSMKFHKSKILGLLGRNGAGKTTIVDMITKVTRPSSGYIKFNKGKQDDKQIRVGICYQHEILYQDLSVINHLKFYSEIKNVPNPEEQIRKIVNKVGIQDQLQKKVKQLSGGNKRKLSFCIALLNSPQLLIFDEPTSGLDPLSRRLIWQILEHLRSSETTIILTTHHLDQADHLSDLIYVIKKGEIIEEGTPSEIKQKHGKGYYLSIYKNENERQQSSPPFDVKLYTKIVTEMLKNCKISDKNSQTIKFFIGRDNDYNQVIRCIETLQRLDGVCISLQANNLEQSFIALNIDQQNRPANAENAENPLLIESRQSQPSEQKFYWQIVGIMLKNWYCYLHKFHYFYNMNLIILIAVTLINNLLLSKLSQKIQITDQQQKEQGKTNPLFIIQGYILMSGAFLAIPVLEKEEKIIQLLRTRGVNKTNYWIGHFLFDFIYFWLNFAALSIGFGEIMGVVPVWVIACTAASMILYAYTISMIFNKVKTANSWFTVINTLLWLLMMPFMLPQKILQKSFYHHFRFLKYLSPFYDISYLLIKNQDIFKAMQMVQLSQQKAEDDQYRYAVHICLVIYLVLFIFLQGKFIQRIIWRKDDETSIDMIKLQNISKKYGNTQALKNVSYKINNQKIALLGHNGAGKSTTFGLLSSQINPSQGKLYLQSRLKQAYEDTMSSAGICYQEDTLWKFMTPSKIITVFSYLTGVSDRDKQEEWLYDNLDIQGELKNRRFENLSGGNKRKICMAVCIMGAPRIKLLDECSTGLDPVSRMSMVNALKAQNLGSIVLTTHSIPQAEQVCSRAIVMKKGQVSQDNKIYKLKQKYYPYYWVSLIRYDAERLSGVTEKMLKQKISPVNYRINQKKNRIQIQKQALKLSQLMKCLQMAKEKGIIGEFNIDEPKLEDVYLLLTAEEGAGQQVQANDINQIQGPNQIEMRQI